MVDCPNVAVAVNNNNNNNNNNEYMYIADALIDQPHIVWLVMENVPILSFNSLSVCVAVLITGISCLIICHAVTVCIL